MLGVSQHNVQPGDVIEFESSEFSRPDALGFVPGDLSNFQSELFVQALVNLSAYEAVGDVERRVIQQPFSHLILRVCVN